MATNTLRPVATDSGNTYPLRGDMGVALDFLPGSGKFKLEFVTEDSNIYVLSSNSAPFIQLDGTIKPNFSFGGSMNMFIKLMFDVKRQAWKVTANNLAGGSGGGTSQPGPAGKNATITIGTVTKLAPGSQPTVVNSGTTVDAVLDFGIPEGEPGQDGTGSGASLPSGGQAGNVLTKTGPADTDVAWAAPTGGAGSSSGGRRAEVRVSPDANGVVTLDGNVSDTFAVVATTPLTFANPTNFTSADEIIVTVKQDDTGGRTFKFGLDYLLPNEQPYAPPANPGAICQMRMKGTGINDKLEWILKGDPDKSIIRGYGPVTELVQIGADKYYTIADAWNAFQPGATPAVILRNGLSAEATGTKFGTGTQVYYIYGKAVPSNGSDQRPHLTLLQFDYGSGGANRPSYEKAILNFEGDGGTFNLRDLVVEGARNAGGDARGICPNGGVSLNLNNVRIYNNNNGMLWGNTEFTGTIRLTDCDLDANGLGTNGAGDGFSHNIYAGHNNQSWYALRTSFHNAVKGHNVKSRAAYTELKQCLIENSREGREIELPNGGSLLVEDSIIHKFGDVAQNDMVRIGDEGIDTGRARSYIFRRCRFICDLVDGKDATFVWNQDPDVDVIFIDCTFEGSAALNNNGDGGSGLATVAGIRGRHHFEDTGGVKGPQGQVGYVAIPMTPIV